MKRILLALLFANLAVGSSFAFNTQLNSFGKVALNPQPEPPGARVMLNPQPEPPGVYVMLNPQPIPPGFAASINLRPMLHRQSAN